MEKLCLASGQKRPHPPGVREPFTGRGNVLLVFIETRRWPHTERLYVGASMGDISMHCANFPNNKRASFWPGVAASVRAQDEFVTNSRRSSPPHEPVKPKRQMFIKM
jgi:hypothetical protein